MKIRAYAKINLALDVVSKRVDGYHELDMIMAPITLHDLIYIDRIEKGIEITSNNYRMPTDERNIMYQVAKILIDRYHIQFGVKIHIFKHIPTQDELDLSKDASYLHICANNTIYGTEWKYVPETNGVPIIADMSSNILSKPVDVSKYGMIYAGAQKNMGIAGLGVAIIREDLLQDVAKTTPVLLDYKLMIKNDSMYNTPPAYAIYVLGLVLEWIDSLGGLEVMKERNEKKAKLVYDYLDQSTFYKAHSDKENRSLMNVTFTTPNKDLDAKFVKESIEAGMTNLKGHRSVGGIRASIYNAMPYEGVEKLVAFMKEFEENNR